MDEKGKKMPNFDGPQAVLRAGTGLRSAAPRVALRWAADPPWGTSGWPPQGGRPPMGGPQGGLPREDLRSEARRVVLQWAARRCSRCIRCRTWATP